MKISMKIACFRIATDLLLLLAALDAGCPNCDFAIPSVSLFAAVSYVAGFKRYCLSRLEIDSSKKLSRVRTSLSWKIVAGPA